MTSECRYGGWSSPRTISDDFVRTGVVARFSSLGATRSGPVYIAGNDIPAMTGDIVPENPLTVWALDGTSLGRPPGTFRFAFPRILIDDRDRLHLLWGEPPPGSPPILARSWHRRPLPTSVWTAVHEPKVGWSTPRKVLDDPTLMWTGHLTASPGEGPARRWALAAPTRRNGVVVLGLENDSVVVADTLPALRGAYTGVASAGHEVFVAFLGGAPAARGVRDGNSVLLQASSDGGTSWRDPVVVSRSGLQHAFELKTLAGPDGTVHLIWLQRREGASQVIRHVSSADGGRTWSAPDDLELAAGTSTLLAAVGMQAASGLQAVIDACGTVHLVFEHWQDSGDPTDPQHVKLQYVTWRERWSRVEPLFDNLEFLGGSTLHRAPDGRLLLAMMARPENAPSGLAVSTMYAELPVVR